MSDRLVTLVSRVELNMLLGNLAAWLAHRTHVACGTCALAHTCRHARCSGAHAHDTGLASGGVRVIERRRVITTTHKAIFEIRLDMSPAQ